MFDKSVLNNQLANISPAQFQAPSPVAPANYSMNAGIENVMQNVNSEPGGWWQKTKDFFGSPFGRSVGAGLLTGGLVAASGGDSLEALSYGAQAGGRAADVNRNELTRKAKRELEEKYFNSKLAEQQIEREARMQELKDRSADNWKMKQADYENALRLLDVKQKNDLEKELVTSGGGVNASLGAVEQQLKEFENTFDNMPSKAEAYTTGALRAATGFDTPEMANFDAQRTLLFNKIARDLGGEKGVLSDADIKRVSAALPTMYDSTEQKKAKMQAVYGLLDIAKQKTAGQFGGFAPTAVNPSVSTVNNDPLGIR